MVAVAPEMLAPLAFHWYLSVTGAGPQVPGLAVNVDPTLAVPVIFGSVSAEFPPHRSGTGLVLDERRVPALVR